MEEILEKSISSIVKLIKRTQILKEFRNQARKFHYYITMTRLKLNIWSINIFNTTFKNIQCFRLKCGYKISNEVQYLGLQLMLVIHQNAIKFHTQSMKFFIQ